MSSLNLSHCLNIPDDFDGYDKNLFCLPSHYRDAVESVLIPYGLVKDRVEKLAVDIFNLYNNYNTREPLIMLCVLKGAHPFYSILQEKLTTLNSQSTTGSIQMSMEFIRVKSYVNTSSTNEITITGFSNIESIRGKNVLIVEDIIDTGRTMKKLLSHLHQYNPKRLSVACLVRKRAILSNKFVPDHVGFEVPDRFIIGFGFDYNECFRDMNHICVINEYGIRKYQQ